MDREQEAIETYLRVFAWVLVGASLLPFDFYGNEPVWPWAGLVDGGWADRTAIMVPLVAGVLFFVLGRLRWHKTTLSIAILGILVTSWMSDIWSSLGPHPLGVYDHLTDGLPPLFSRAFWLVIMGVSFLAAGIRLGARGFLRPEEGRPGLSDPWFPARLLTGAGIFLVTLFYLLPYRGTIPIWRLIAGIFELSAHLEEPTGLALLAGHVLSLGPLLFSLASVVRLWRRAPEHGGMLLALLLAFLPVLSLLVGMRNFAVLVSYTLLHLRSVALILAVSAGAAMAMSTFVRGTWYEVPWTFGRLTLSDRILASALSEQDAANRLAHSLGRLHPVLRPFVRRRLTLWRSAAAGVPGADQADLSRVMSFLLRRFREEEEEDQDEPPRQWPAWMRGPSLSILAGAILILLTGLTFLAAHREGNLSVCRLDPPDPIIESVFTESIPAVVIDMSQSEGPVEELASFLRLEQELEESERFCPGIRDAVTGLVLLGEQGRRRLHSIWRKRDHLNLLLHNNRLPYFVRSRVRAARGTRGRDLFYLLTYRVTGCKVYRAWEQGRHFPVLRLVRADPLNVIEQYVGATAEEEAFVSILVDRVDDFMNKHMAPAAEWDDEVGDAVRAGVAAAGGTPDQLYEGVEGPLGAFIIEGLARHELHHKWLGLDPEPPTALWAWMTGYSDNAVSSVASEVGAYLGELRFKPAYARLRIALMVAALDDEQGRSGTYGWARMFLLARLFGVESSQSPQWLAMEVSSAMSVLEEMSDQELIGKLDDLHRELFGTPAPVFSPVPGP